MNQDEFTILNFLKGSPESYFARREIARRAVKRTVYEESPHWADAPLGALVARGLIEQSNEGLYKFKKDGY